MSGHNRKKIAPFSGTKTKFGDLIGKAQPFVQRGLDRFNNGAGGTTDLLGYTKNEGVTSETSASAELLNLLKNGGNTQDILAAWIQNMSQNENFEPEIRDQLRQLLFQMLLTSDQRAYDKELLADSRLYNNPINELQRLMGAGIGRDAAIQILSGSAGNSGVSQGTAATAPSVPATSGTSELQQKQFTLGAVQSVVSMIGQLVDSGLSLAQGVETVKGMQMQNSMTQQQLVAYQSTNQLAQQIELLKQSGALESSEIEQLSNADDLIKYLNKVSDGNADVMSLLQSDAYKNTFGSLAGREFFNNYWQGVRSSRDAGTIADRYLHSLELDNNLKQVSVDKIGAEMSLIGEQENEIEQRIIESAARVADINADIQVKNKQGEWISVQTKNYQRLVDAEINQLDASAWLANNQGEFAIAQTEGQTIQNAINQDIFEVNHAGFPMMRDAHLIECQRELRKLRFQNDPEGQKKQLQAWALEQDNAIKLAYFEQIYYNSAGDFIQNHPSLYALATGFHMCGAGDLVQAGATTTSAVSGAVKTVSKLVR